MSDIKITKAIPSVLPAVKGLFKKNDVYAGNGWGNVKRDFLENKILAKLHDAGYVCITTKTEHGDSGDNFHSLYANLLSGDAVTLSGINYAEAYDNKGRERGFCTFGNVDLYRGEPMKKVLDILGYGIEDGFVLPKEVIENKKKEKEAENDFKVDSKASNSDNDKIIVEEEKPFENACNDGKTDFTEELSILEPILRKKLTTKEIQIVKNELLRLRNNRGDILLQ